MGHLKKLNIYFSITAFVVSTLVCIVKGITPLVALLRVFLAVTAFYILGFCISIVLTKDAGQRPEQEDSPELIQDAGEEFEEIEFPVVDIKKMDIPIRG
jgi:hypothetical protein